MPYNTLITSQTLAEHLSDLDWVIVDCRFNLDDTEAGRRAYEAEHIPGAVYAHLNDDLSGPPITDRGRHPLPAPQALTALFSRLGIDGETQVIAYDDSGGIIAARLWWMLHYMGHETAAVLDGGWSAWKEAGLPTASGTESNPPATFSGAARRDRLVLLDEVLAVRHLVDARDPARYRGEEEPRDPVAGHIPGAINYAFANNLDKMGRFLPPAQLRRRLEAALPDAPSAEVVFYCGSGVSACHNLLAQAHAGLSPGRLYVGSWSEWCADPSRPIA